jgi:hypothetical protein
MDASLELNVIHFNRNLTRWPLALGHNPRALVGVEFRLQRGGS